MVRRPTKIKKIIVPQVCSQQINHGYRSLFSEIKILIATDLLQLQIIPKAYDISLSYSFMMQSNMVVVSQMASFISL